MAPTQQTAFLTVDGRAAFPAVVVVSVVASVLNSKREVKRPPI